MRAVLIAAVLLGGCRCGGGGAKQEPDPGSGRGRGTGRGTGADASSDAFAPLDGLPKIRPRWTRTLPEQPVPAIDVHGPRIVDGVAVVAGSAIGVVGVDVGKGEVLWSRPAGARVALPALLGTKLLVAGDCMLPVDGDHIVGCYEVIDPRKLAVYGYGSIVSETVLGAGPTDLAVEARTAYLGREGQYLRFTVPDPPRGEVRAEKTRWREVVTVGEGDDKVEAWIVDDVLELRHHRPDIMSSRSAVRSIAGGTGAMYRMADDRTRAFRYPDGKSEIQPVLIDLAAIEIADLGAAVPGIDLLAAAQSEKGYAIAVRLDSSLLHDYVARFTADGTMVWVWPLPPPPGGGRALPVGLAWTADDGLVVFHDGTTLAYLP